ncbi:hypothetical protein OG978_14665 [Streptomyces sp. NBC_01591]|uniref:hypothetical protein n=1 Tax=Streptomyces sp. NBC_01591 TaxID=2975888 RepID=UPI002DD929DA|nr:hypothetical protein [Streptomyces sp. NBC_01591]WSD68540.1 hypothetical protein OG978_14665 [Streptomyces sp. NBC_01591]
MTVPVRSLEFADTREAADLAAFLGRLLHYDRAAVVRMQAGGGALAVFGRPPSFEVLAIRAARLAGPAGNFDVTVSAGELLESLDVEGAAAGSGSMPAPVTGPPWTGVLPPRGGWRELPGLPDPVSLRAAVAAAVAEFRSRDEALPEERRTRAERDLIGREIWSRTVAGTGLPLRAVHAAQSLGFLRPAPDFPVALLAAGSWLRLRTPFGSVALRGPGSGLGTLAVSVGTG